MCLKNLSEAKNLKAFTKTYGVDLTFPLHSLTIIFLWASRHQGNRMLTSMFIHLVLHVVIFNTLINLVFFVGPEFLFKNCEKNEFFLCHIHNVSTKYSREFSQCIGHIAGLIFNHQDVS